MAVDGFEQYRRNQIATAIRASELSRARLQGLKSGVFVRQPKAAEGHMPFAGHRSCDQWLPQYRSAKHGPKVSAHG